MSRHSHPVAPIDHVAAASPTVETASDYDAPAAHRTGVPSVSAKTAVAPNDYSDLVFGGSFIAAALFGLGNVINNIRHAFYESKIKPPAHLLDIARYTDAEASKLHPFAQPFRDHVRAQQKYSAELAEGKITGKQMLESVYQHMLERDKMVDALSRKHYDIARTGLRSWFTDVFSMRKHTGAHSRTQVALTTGGATALALGAIATLKYTKHLLNRIDENEQQQQAFFDQTKNIVPFNRVSEVTHADRVASPPALQVG